MNKNTLIVKPRPEIDDPEKFGAAIVIENLTKDTALEADSQWFFTHTYPSEEARDLLSELSSLAKRGRSRTIVARGGYGTGKSHLLALGFHFFKNPNATEKWLRNWTGEFPSLKDIEVPLVVARPIVFSTKAQGGRHRYLWEAIFSECVETEESTKAIELFKKQTLEGRSPDKQAIADAFGIVSQGKYLAVILDELDAWVGELLEAKRANVNFIEKLAEVFLQGLVKGVLILSIRGKKGEEELVEALNRAKPKVLSPGARPDRSTIIRYRLFEEPTIDQRNLVQRLVDGYLETYMEMTERFKSDETLKHIAFDHVDWEKLRQRMSDLYPFNPRFLETLLRKYDALMEESKEGIRGPMFVLIDIVSKARESVDLISSGDASYRTLFEILRDETLRNKIEEDLQRFRESKADQVLCEQLLNVMYLCSLKENGKIPAGAGGSDLVFGVGRPGLRTYDLIESVRKIVDESLYIYPESGRLLIKNERKVHVEIQDIAKKLLAEPDKVMKRLGTLMRENVAKSPTNSDTVVVLEDPDAVSASLKGKRFRVLYSLKRESDDDELHKRIWPWFEKIDPPYRNLAVAIVPSRGVDLSEDPDFLSNLRTMIAAEEVQQHYHKLAGDADKDRESEYLERARKAEEFANSAASKIAEHLKEQQWNLVSFTFDEKHGLRPYPEPYGAAEIPSYNRVRLSLKQKYEQNLRIVKDEIQAFRAKQGDALVSGATILDHFYGTPGLPIITDECIVTDALRELPLEDTSDEFMIDDRPAEKGKKLPPCSIDSIKIARRPSLRVALPQPKAEQAVGTSRPEVKVMSKILEGEPYQVLSDIESLLASKTGVWTKVAELTLTLGEDVPLSNLSGGT